MMLSTTRYHRLALLLTCIVANLFVSFYVIATLLSLTGSTGYDTDQRTDNQLLQTSSPVTSIRSPLNLPWTAGEGGRTGRRWRYDRLLTSYRGYVLEPLDAAEGRYCDRLQTSNQSVLILVCSAVENVDRRKAIRSTWGDAALLADVGARLVFVVGRTDPTRSPPGIQRRVEAEHQRHGDVVQTDFVDGYVNLTAKTVAALRWAGRACPRVRHVMKCDDDVYVDALALTRRLVNERETQRSTFGIHENSEASSGFIMGHVVDAARPVRDRRSKWYTPESIYPDEFYPPYTSGTGYVLGASVLHRLKALLDDARSGGAVVDRPFWLEDIYITGMLAARLSDVRLIHDARFNFRPTYRIRRTRHHHGGQSNNVDDGDEEACAYRDAITVHDLTPTELLGLWKRLRRLRLDDS